LKRAVHVEFSGAIWPAACWIQQGRITAGWSRMLKRPQAWPRRIRALCRPGIGSCSPVRTSALSGRTSRSRN